MNEMITFSREILFAIADFLGTPPVFYLFSLCCFAVVVEIFRRLMR